MNNCMNGCELMKRNERMNEMNGKEKEWMCERMKMNELMNEWNKLNE